MAAPRDANEGREGVGNMRRMGDDDGGGFFFNFLVDAGFFRPTAAAFLGRTNFTQRLRDRHRSTEPTRWDGFDGVRDGRGLFHPTMHSKGLLLRVLTVLRRVPILVA